MGVKTREKFAGKKGDNNIKNREHENMKRRDIKKKKKRRKKKLNKGEVLPRTGHEVPEGE